MSQWYAHHRHRNIQGPHRLYSKIDLIFRYEQLFVTDRNNM